MADLVNIQPRQRTRTATIATSAAVDIDVALYDTFNFTADTSTGAPVLTWINVVAGRSYVVSFFWTLPGTTDYLKPTNAASTNSAGTTLVFHTVGTGAANAAWPTFSTTADLVDYFRWESPDGVNFYLTNFLVGLDE